MGESIDDLVATKFSLHVEQVSLIQRFTQNSDNLELLETAQNAYTWNEKIRQELTPETCQRATKFIELTWLTGCQESLFLSEDGLTGGNIETSVRYSQIFKYTLLCNKLYYVHRNFCNEASLLGDDTARTSQKSWDTSLRYSQIFKYTCDNKVQKNHILYQVQINMIIVFPT